MAHPDPSRAKFGAARLSDNAAPSTDPAGFDPADDSGPDATVLSTRSSAANRQPRPRHSSSSTDGVNLPDAHSNNQSSGDATGRGKLVLEARVVEKIAAQAASEVSAAGGTTGGVFGIGAKTDLSARPKVDVHLSGRTATVDVAVAVAYPTSIRQATDRVRDHIIDRVETLTGVQVTRVDIKVTALHATENTLTEGLR